MRDHGHPDAMLSAFLDDELDEAASLKVAHHVSACLTCLAELDGLRAAREALRGLPRISAPAALFAEVPDTAERAGQRQRGRRAAATALVGVSGLLVAAFVLGGSQHGDVVPPVDAVVVDHVMRTGGGPVIQPVDLER